MSVAGRHVPRVQPPAPTRLGVTAAVVALVAVGVMIAAVLAANPGRTGAVPAKAPPSAPIDKANAVPSLSPLGGPRGSGSPTAAPGPGHGAAVPLVLTAAGGIAFHGGSLTAWSHGCVHLTDASARYYNENLPIGAQVVVF